MRRGAFHGLLAWVTGLSYRDLGCGARAFDRRVLEEIQLYGDQHRFLPVLADRKGFRVSEMDVRQSPKDRHEGIYEPRVYARGFLDIFTVFFLVRFTKKPLRFFGMIGVTLFAIGALLVTWLVIERLFFGQGLTQRPALLLSTLLVVLGLQLFALGLLGELIIFTHARQVRDYQIDSVLSFQAGAVGYFEAERDMKADEQTFLDFLQDPQETRATRRNRCVCRAAGHDLLRVSAAGGLRIQGDAAHRATWTCRSNWPAARARRSTSSSACSALASAC